MPTLRRAEARRAAPLAIIALGATLLLLGAGGTRSRPDVVYSAAAAWHGLVGDPRPPVTVGQRMLVVLRAPSLAVRVAQVGGRATESQERRWTAAAIASQKQLLTTLAAEGVQIRADYNYARVLNGFSAALDARAAALLERRPEVAGVYPVRVAYPASISSQLVRRGLARGAAARPDILLPGFDGRGVTIALLDTGVDRAHPYLRGRVLDGINLLGDDDYGALPKAKPGDWAQLERHGTQMAGLLVGAGGPAGLAGVATGASVLPIRVAGWQPDVSGSWAVYSRTDQLLDGLERAVDPNEDGDAHDAARIALVGVAEPYASFGDSPEARAVEGATELDTLVVAPAGNDGPAGPAFGSISGPGGAPSALAVGAADLRSEIAELRVVVRVRLRVIFDRMLPLAGAIVPAKPHEVPLGAPEEPERPTSTGGFAAPPSIASFFDGHGLSRVAGRAALVEIGDDVRTAAIHAAQAGAAAVLLYGSRLPPGGVGLDESVSVPVIGIPQSVAEEALRALRRGEEPAVTLGVPRLARNGRGVGIAAFSSRGSAFNGRVKPDVAAPGVALMTADPGANEDGSPRFATVNGSSAAAATVAGAAAVLAQARPDLGARELASLLVGSARPLAGTPVNAEGAGVVDLGASAAAEIAAEPTGLRFGQPRTARWRERRTLIVHNVSSRRLVVRVRTDRGGGAGLAIAARPTLLRLRAGTAATVTLTARLLGQPGTAATPAEGTVQLVAGGASPLRIPWTIAFGPVPRNLIQGVRLSSRSFRPSDTTPAVLAFRAGRLPRSPDGVQVQALARLDIELRTGDGESLGLLARLRDLLPGRYAFGITGRGPAGELLTPGSYKLRLVAVPTVQAPPTRKTVRFTIK